LINVADIAMSAGYPCHPWPQVAQAPADYVFMRPEGAYGTRSHDLLYQCYVASLSASPVVAGGAKRQPTIC